jgi:hypothetical protein
MQACWAAGRIIGLRMYLNRDQVAKSLVIIENSVTLIRLENYKFFKINKIV